MPAYSLGAFTFISANREDVRGGIPPMPMEWVEAIPPPPGIDGIAIRNNGRRGEPFRYRTCAYAASSAAALTLFSLYHATPGNVPQNLVWEGIDYDDAQIRFTVLNVAEHEVRYTSGLIVDGTVLGSKYLLYATWTLLPVDMV